MTQNKITFEHHLSERVMEIHFENGFKLKSSEDLEALKEGWTKALKKWHSPYTCLFDCRDMEIDAEMAAPFERLIKFFKNFFMKKCVGFVKESEKLPEAHVPFEVFAGYEEAAKKTGLARGAGLERDLTQLRSRIQIDNDFAAHVMEVSFLAPSHFDTDEDITTLRSKLQNIIMMWHTPYSLVFNLENCTFSENGKQKFAPVERFLKGFFCKTIIGYAPTGDKESYPFPSFRSRHRAVGTLNHEGLVSGDEANCSSRKTQL